MSNKVKKSLCAIAATMLVLVSVFAVFTVPSKAEQWKITYYANDGSGHSQVVTSIIHRRLHFRPSSGQNRKEQRSLAGAEMQMDPELYTNRAQRSVNYRITSTCMPFTAIR